MAITVATCSVSLQVEEGWWEGLLNGKTGMFPSNFTKEVLAESDSPSVDTPNSQEESHGARTSESSRHHQSGLSIASDLLPCVLAKVKAVRAARATEQTVARTRAPGRSSPRR